MSQLLSSKGTAQTGNMPVARLPWLALLALAMTGFICIFTETIPAGLLPHIAGGLNITTGMPGSSSLPMLWVPLWRQSRLRCLPEG